MTANSPTLCVDCPPKVNLYLRILGRRADGFHELETVFQSISGGDTLCAVEAAELSLRCSDPEIPADERNLVWRAAEALRRAFPEALNRGAALTLVKRTPAGAGLGGGSADAAGALLLLARLWGLAAPEEAPPEALVDLAARLGSDVPFFLHGGTAIARGRGERLEPVPTAPLWLVVVKPPVSVATPWAYAQWRPDESADAGPSLEAFLHALASRDPARIAAALRNDLEAGVARAVPEIAAAREWLLDQGMLGARMTGSGSAVFAIARSEAEAREVAARRLPFEGGAGRAWAARCLTAEEAALRPAVRRAPAAAP